LPDLNERKEIFKVHLRPLTKLDPEVSVDFLAKQTPGFSGADIANVVNEAALIAARHDKAQVEKSDFFAAVDRSLVAGKEKQIFSWMKENHCLSRSRTCHGKLDA
jgi:cell division protease FtsH